jgi:glycosyltransferase involved in cell wall biosynthesis
MEFSVSMCVYGKDNPEWFKTAVESVINQTVKPSEIVLVVDGPVEGELQEVIKSYEQEDLFNVIYLPENQGHGNARRKGLENCKYDLVALMDADDISLPDRFEKQINEFAKDDSLSIVGGNISEFIDSEENVVGYRVVPETHEQISEYLKKRCPFNQVSVMFSRKDVESVGGYIDWFWEEDYELYKELIV